jgi:hypothetical protein
MAFPLVRPCHLTMNQPPSASDARKPRAVALPTSYSDVVCFLAALGSANEGQPRQGGVDPAALTAHSGLTVGSDMDRIRYDDYLLATTLTLAHRHRPVWSWKRWRRVCRCGKELPCRARHRIPINRGHWLDGEFS